MRMSGVAGIFVLCIFLTGPAYSADAECRLGRDGSITIGECTSQVLNQVDIELNVKYQHILGTLKNATKDNPHLANARAQLIMSQRSWVKFRDSDCRAFASYLPND